MPTQFEKWLLTSPGQQFFSVEKTQIHRVSSMLCGAYGLQLTLTNYDDMLNGLSVATAVRVGNEPFSHRHETEQQLLNPNNYVLADGDALPFANKEFNVVLAPHLVDLNTDPQAVLREIYRVTAPEGLVLLTALNPYSLLGIQTQLFRKRFRFLPKVGLGRMKDWLNLLGFDIVAGSLFQYSLLNTKSHSRVARAYESIGDRWLPMTAGAYLLVVRKRVFGQTLVGFNKRKRYTNAGLIKPASLKLSTSEPRSCDVNSPRKDK